MRLVFGLGNPGPEYRYTRHNAGFDAADRAAAFFQVSLKKRCCRLYSQAEVPGGRIIKPLTHMNSSGNIMHWFRNDWNTPSEIAVICDNMDLACGGLRIRLGGGSSGQKGLNSIAAALGTTDFVHIYIGVGRPSAGVPVNDHVLGVEHDPRLLKAYNEAVQAAADAAVKFLSGVSVEVLQNEFSRKGIF